MNEKPILFSTEMVKALLDGRKTQTRRVVKLRHFENSQAKSIQKDGSGTGYIAWMNSCVSAEETKKLYPGSKGFKCPYGQVGDLLWVREKWQFFSADLVDFGECTFKFSTGELHTWDVWDELEQKDHTEWAQEQFQKLEKKGVFRLDDNPDLDEDDLYYIRTDAKQAWCPSIHLMKVAARIWLQVTNVRVERLQDVNGIDCSKEGIKFIPRAGGSGYGLAKEWNYRIPIHESTPVGAFKMLWESINGADSWNANPWVWVISFKMVSTTGREHVILSPSKEEAAL